MVDGPGGKRKDDTMPGTLKHASIFLAVRLNFFADLLWNLKKI